MATYNIGPGQTYETFDALVASVSLANGDIVDGGGNTFRETWSASGLVGVIFQDAIIYGSDAINDDGWTNSTGGEYTHALTIEPQTVFTVGGIKLWKGTAGVLGNNEWDWASDVLTINIGVDPSGVQIECGARDNCVAFVNCTGPETRRIMAYGANSDCIWHGTCSSLRSFDCSACFSGGDGFKGVSGSPNFNIVGLVAKYNGLDWPPSAGPGDGVSFHDASNGTISGCYFEGNGKAGVANVDQADLVVEKSKFVNNYNSFRPSSLIGYTQTFRNNLCCQDWEYERTIVEFINDNGGSNSNDIYHNTFIGVGTKPGNSRVLRQLTTGGMSNFRDNIAVNVDNGLLPAVAAAGLQSGHNNCWHNVTIPYGSNATGATGTGDLAVDPDFWSSPDCLTPMNFELMQASSDGSDIGALYVDAPMPLKPCVARPIKSRPCVARPVRGGYMPSYVTNVDPTPEVEPLYITIYYIGRPSINPPAAMSEQVGLLDTGLAVFADLASYEDAENAVWNGLDCTEDCGQVIAYPSKELLIDDYPELAGTTTVETEDGPVAVPRLSGGWC